MIVFDIETNPKGEIVIIGVMEAGRFRYFCEAHKFYNWLKAKNIREIWAHNLEFDFFKLYEALPSLRFCAYFSTDRLSYVQNGNIFFKDLYNHLPFTLERIGKFIGIRKLKFDYSKIRKPTKKLIKYNERDCLITYKALETIKNIYKQEGMNRVKSTIGSEALNIFLKKFYKHKFAKLDRYDLSIWRSGYKGGWCEAFMTGERSGLFYKIDVNSLYPFIMRTAYPMPIDYHVEPRKSGRFWLGVRFNDGVELYNSIEHKDIFCDYYYNFSKSCYPFKDYIKYFYAKKQNSQGLNKEIYKKLLNALYGKFGQKFETDVISNYDFRKRYIHYRVKWTEDLYRVKFESKGKFWVNIIWSLFVTAKAREYMRAMKRYIESKGLIVYYTDTDSFIISGDIEKIKPIISDNKLGLFKIEDMSSEIDIRGKKMYRFGTLYKCKGLPYKYRKEFFEKGFVEYNKMVRYREAFTRGLKLGTMIKAKKKDIKNKPLTDNK